MPAARAAGRGSDRRRGSRCSSWTSTPSMSISHERIGRDGALISVTVAVGRRRAGRRARTRRRRRRRSRRRSRAAPRGCPSRSMRRRSRPRGSRRPDPGLRHHPSPSTNITSSTAQHRPVLAGLGRRSTGWPFSRAWRRRVAVRRRVTAADLAARLAHPQVDPATAARQTLLAAGHGLGGASTRTWSRWVQSGIVCLRRSAWIPPLA